MIKNLVRFLSLNYILLFALLPANLSAQVSFEKGYYIGLDNKKVDCYIKNHDWRKIPTKLEYKATLEEKTKTIAIAEVNQFEVSNLKYERHTVQVDQSGKTVNDISMQYAPEFAEKNLMLKKLIEGRANLYFDSNSQLFFYSIDKHKPEQLIYKEYSRDGKVLKNTSYRLQLIKALSCEDITTVYLQNLSYLKSDFIKVFETYNTCLSAPMIKYGTTKKSGQFNVTINSGVRVSNIKYVREYSATSFHFDKSVGFTSDIQFEYILPFNKNKWSFFINPTFQSYTTDFTYSYVDYSTDYKSIELPIGVKYSMFFSDKSKMFIEASGFLIDIPFDSYVGSREVDNGGGYIYFGGGYAYNRFNFKVKYGTHPDIISQYTNYTAAYHSLSLTLGYQLF
jgi:hypothetical protein